MQMIINVVRPANPFHRQKKMIVYGLLSGSKRTTKLINSQNVCTLLDPNIVYVKKY